MTAEMQMDEETRAELADRALDGFHPMTRAGIEAELMAHGYKMASRAECFCRARIMSHPARPDRVGATYKSASYRVMEVDTGRSCWNVDARRDANYRWLQDNRDRLFYIARGAIVSL